MKTKLPKTRRGSNLWMINAFDKTTATPSQNKTPVRLNAKKCAKFTEEAVHSALPKFSDTVNAFPKDLIVIEIPRKIISPLTVNEPLLRYIVIKNPLKVKNKLKL